VKIDRARLLETFQHIHLRVPDEKRQAICDSVQVAIAWTLSMTASLVAGANFASPEPVASLTLDFLASQPNCTSPSS
jgi:hypothetical protein